MSTFIEDAPVGNGEPRLYSVSELNREVRGLLEGRFPEVFVEGEVSNFRCPSSGHWYFGMKDETAQLRCVMFRGDNRRLGFRPQDGEAVRARGRLSLYEGRGEFQLVAAQLEQSRAGELHRRFEELKRRLQEEGLFDAAHKKPLPPHPRHIVVVSSLAAAALRDVLRVCRERLPVLRISICPASVQGDAAVQQICAALDLANRYQPAEGVAPELILLARGGGSPEDLQAFNEEAVARAIFRSKLPVVSAVGHETDVSIADFVADLRAPTPSAAAATVTPESSAYVESLRQFARQLRGGMDNKLRGESLRLEGLRRGLSSPRTRLQEQAQRLDRLEQGLRLHVRSVVQRGSQSLATLRVGLRHPRTRLQEQERHLGRLEQGLRLHVRGVVQRCAHSLATLRAALRGHSPRSAVRDRRVRTENLHGELRRGWGQLQQERRRRLQLCQAALQNLGPHKILERGYAIVEDQDGRIVRHAEQTQVGALLRTQLARGALHSRVEKRDTVNSG